MRVHYNSQSLFLANMSSIFTQLDLLDTHRALIAASSYFNNAISNNPQRDINHIEPVEEGVAVRKMV